ncbi:MAG: 6,7-dimethyl-8-ribityllumazine synthase [Actinomycetota bacterium]|nr:6,7-dimethyl-8-ribityllumazine synthase [Actinomycetota bacterium]
MTSPDSPRGAGVSPDMKSELQTGRAPTLDGAGLRISIACARFNDVITDRLLAGCRAGLVALGVKDDDITEVWTPGAFELPLIAKRLAETGVHDAVITLGAVVRGGTPHFDYVAGECAAGVMRVSLATGVPIVFGVLTTDTVEQAMERSVESLSENKGYDSALTAVEMAGLLRSIT